MYRLLGKGGAAKAALLRRSQTQAQATRSRREMCGLVAAIDDIWTSPPCDAAWHGTVPILASQEELSRTSSILHHRGPDSVTVRSGTVGKYSQRWSMGHTRLAIVDPGNRNADMPFTFAFDNQTIHLAANGEIYNYKTLYKDLARDKWPHARFSGSDCEVIGHALCKYGGPATVAKLDGMFAFVAFQEDNLTGDVTAFAARDPVGIKPLYYGRTSSTADTKDASAYVFASELKALVGHVDPSTVVSVPPGHYWTPEEGLVCYYNPDWLRKVSKLDNGIFHSSRNVFFLNGLFFSIIFSLMQG
jgi:asparagine synthetase B (glutamine-hydrolysing)